MAHSNPYRTMMDRLDDMVKSRFIEMFGHIRTNSKSWRCNKLGDLGDFKTGGTPSSKHEEFYNGTIPFISTPSLGPNYIDETAAKYLITQDAIDSCATTLIPSGSLIIGTRINVGQSSINKIPLCTNQDIVSMMNVSDNYDLLFLKHCIEQYVPYLDSQKKGATIKGITVDLLKSISIPEPPIDFQRQYVNFVQQVDKSKDIVQKCIDKYDQLVKSRFIEMFGDPFINVKGWPIEPLSKHIIEANNGMTRRGNDENGSIVLRLVELQKGFIDYSNPNRILPNEKESLKYTANKGDFLFARVNGNPSNVGRCAVFDGYSEEVLFNDHIIRVKFDSKIGSTYFITLINSDYGRNQFKDKIKTSAGQYTVSQDGIASIIVPMPPISLQNEYEQFVKQVDKSKFE